MAEKDYMDTGENLCGLCSELPRVEVTRCKRTTGVLLALVLAQVL